MSHRGHNILLIGLMGVGKSYIGRKLALIKQTSFIDTDQYIIQSVNKSLPEIFEQQGEAYFRQLENQLLENWVEEDLTCHIISTGGGMSIAPINQPLLLELGFIVWLHAPQKVLCNRLIKNLDDRPLLTKNNLSQTLDLLIEQRHPVYRNLCHFSIDTSRNSAEQVVRSIEEASQGWFDQRLQEKQKKG